MNLNELRVPIATVVAVVAVSYGLWEKYATKSYVQNVQEPLAEAVQDLSGNLQKQTAIQEQLATDVRRNRSHMTTDKITLYYNRLCYEDDLDRETRQGIRAALNRYEAEYHEITGRPFDPPRCPRR